MKIYILDAFTENLFSGNPAGVVWIQRGEKLSDAIMQQIARELKHSETAFIQEISKNEFQLRYFTVTDEVAMCGHATISAFTALREEGVISPGKYLARTKSGDLPVLVTNKEVWMNFQTTSILRHIDQEESEMIYQAFGLTAADKPEAARPAVVCAGLCDILLPVKEKFTLDQAGQDIDAVKRLSVAYHTVGVHMYCLSEQDGVTAYCRNFAPLFGIEEEAATGTSNAGLTHYLAEQDVIAGGEVNQFIQGEAMGRTSVIKTKAVRMHNKIQIEIGGSAVLFLKADYLHQFAVL